MIERFADPFLVPFDLEVADSAESEKACCFQTAMDSCCGQEPVSIQLAVCAAYVVTQVEQTWVVGRDSNLISVVASWKLPHCHRWRPVYKQDDRMVRSTS